MLERIPDFGHRHIGHRHIGHLTSDIWTYDTGKEKRTLGTWALDTRMSVFFRTRMNTAHVSVISKDTKYGIQSGDLGQVVLQKSKGDNSRGWGITGIENKMGFHI